MAQVFEIIRGDDTDLQLTFTYLNGDPIDLTGCTVFLTAKRMSKNADDHAVISAEQDSFVDPEDGIAIVTLTASQTDIEPGNYYYDVQLKDSEGKITSAVKGLMRVLSDITQRTS